MLALASAIYRLVVREHLLRTKRRVAVRYNHCVRAADSFARLMMQNECVPSHMAICPLSPRALLPQLCARPRPTPRKPLVSETRSYTLTDLPPLSAWCAIAWILHILQSSVPSYEEPTTMYS